MVLIEAKNLLSSRVKGRFFIKTISTNTKLNLLIFVCSKDCGNEVVSDSWYLNCIMELDLIFCVIGLF